MQQRVIDDQTWKIVLLQRNLDVVSQANNGDIYKENVLSMINMMNNWIPKCHLGDIKWSPGILRDDPVKQIFSVSCLRWLFFFRQESNVMGVVDREVKISHFPGSLPSRASFQLPSNRRVH